MPSTRTLRRGAPARPIDDRVARLRRAGWLRSAGRAARRSRRPASVRSSSRGTRARSRRAGRAPARGRCAGSSRRSSRVSPVVRREPDRQRLRARPGKRRTAAEQRRRGRRPGWTSTCQSTGTRATARVGHLRGRRRQERADRRQQRDADGDPDGGRGQPRRAVGERARAARSARPCRPPGRRAGRWRIVPVRRAGAPATAGSWVADDERGAGVRRRPSSSTSTTAARVGPVELAGRLVGQDQPRLARQRAGDGDALGLAAGDLLRAACRRARRRSSRASAAGAPRALAVGLAGEQQRQRDVLEHGQRREQARPLEDHGDRAGRSASRSPIAGHVTVRPSASSSPASRCSRVDLPDPDGPTSAIRSPADRAVGRLQRDGRRRPAPVGAGGAVAAHERAHASARAVAQAQLAVGGRRHRRGSG